MAEWVLLGRRLGAFMPRLSADVAALAKKMRSALLTREDMPKLRATPWRQNSFEPGDDSKSVYDWLAYILNELPDEGYKLFPWVVREVKAQRIGEQNFRHSMDILRQAIHWMVWSNEHNKPMPDYMSKTFDFAQLESWVYEMNARGVDTSEGVHWPDSQTVYTFPDGWHIDSVGATDLPQEGELMGHCVGGYGYQQSVKTGDSTIFSLRDPQGGPHVTIEMGGDRTHDTTKGYGEVEHHDRDMLIMQEYGKSDSTPIPEYKDRMDAWYDHLRQEGWYVQYSDDQDPEMREYMGDTNVYPPTHEGIQEFYTNLQDDPWKLERDEDPHVEYDRGRTIWNERVPDFIGHPTNTWRDDQDQAWPSRADTTHLYPALDQTLAGLWRGTIPASEAQWYAQAYIAAAHHTSGGYEGRGENIFGMVDDLVQHASQWVAEKTAQAPPSKSNQPTLFEPNYYFDKAQAPAAVTTFLHYLTAYHFAGNAPNGKEGYYGERRNWPTMPGEGSWPVSEFHPGRGYGTTRPNYFAQLEETQPSYFNRNWLDQLTPPGQMLAKLVRMASSPSHEYPKCPFDDAELDLHLHGGASCPQCGADFEIRNGSIIPSDDTVWAQAQAWPDTLPQEWATKT